VGVFKSGRLWGIDYYDGFTRRRKLIGPSKGEAKKILAAKRLERTRGLPETLPPIDAPTFAEFVERYSEYSKTNKRGFYNEEARLLAACDQVRTSQLRQLVTIALNTGMRKGEIHSLRWEHLDLPNRSIHVLNGKTERSDRHIPMNDAVFEVLSTVQLRQKNDFVYPSTRKNGEHLRDPKKGFAKALRLAQIPHLRFHDLRHTFATRIVHAGVDIITLKDLLGHTKITTTARYTHPLADDKMAAVKRLDFADF